MRRKLYIAWLMFNPWNLWTTTKACWSLWRVWGANPFGAFSCFISINQLSCPEVFDFYAEGNALLPWNKRKEQQ